MLFQTQLFVSHQLERRHSVIEAFYLHSKETFLSPSVVVKPAVHILFGASDPLLPNLHAALSPFFLVHIYSSKSEFLAKTCCDATGCILVTQELGDISGIDFIAQMVQEKSPMPAILLCQKGTFSLAVAAFRNGAFDVFEAAWPNEAFLERVRAALLTSQEVHRARAKRILAARVYAKLTKREREVIALVSAGRPNKRIAYELSISEKTVETHRARSLRKLGVDNPLALGRLLANLE